MIWWQIILDIGALWLLSELLYILIKIIKSFFNKG